MPRLFPAGTTRPGALLTSDPLHQIRHRLDELEREVALRPDVPIRATRHDPPCDNPGETWGGGGLVVFHHPPKPPQPEDDPWGRFAHYVTVVTPHAGALYWLLLASHEVGLDFIRMAWAALRYQDTCPQHETERGILQAMVAEARAMVAEMEGWVEALP